MHLTSPYIASVKITLLALASIFINACSSSVVPDLSRLYKTAELPHRSQNARSNKIQPPVILIHGAFGSRLIDRETSEEYWPGSLWRLLFSSYEDIALPLKVKHWIVTSLISKYGGVSNGRSSILKRVSQSLMKKAKSTTTCW